MANVRITAARDTLKIDQSGRLETWRRYDYMIEDLGPFIHELPADQDTPEKLAEAITKTKATLASVK